MTSQPDGGKNKTATPVTKTARTSGRKPRMRNGLRQRSEGTWEYYILVPDPLTGKKKQQWHTARGPYEEVKAKRRDEQAEALKHPIRDPDRKVAEQWRYWREEVCSVRNSRSDLVRKETHGRRHVLPTLGDRRLRDVHAEDIQSLLNHLLQGTAPNQTAALSDTSVEGIYRNIRAFFRHAYQNGLIARCPTDNGAVVPPRVTPYEGHYWTAEQARVALNDLRDAGLYLPVRIALQTGLRVGEIAGLSAEYVDLDAPLIEVRWAVDRSAQPIELKPPKTAKSRRILPIRRGLAERLRPLVESALRRPPTIVGTPGTPLHLLFGNPDGSPRTSTWVGHRFAEWRNRRAAALGLPRVRFHDLRDSFAVMLLERGESIYVVSRTLGHSSVNVTEQRYLRYTARMAQHARDAVVTALGDLDTDAAGSRQ